MNERERGQVTAFVVIFTTALVFVAGLVVDGGSILAAKRRAMNEAEGAARAGAAAIDALNIDAFRADGSVVLDAGRAVAAAREYLQRAGHPDADIAVTADRVRVVVRFAGPEMLILGLGTGVVTGTGEARAVRGVSEGET
jgi:Putative Flp pilus-assembly TadE/G-like